MLDFTSANIKVLLNIRGVDFILGYLCFNNIRLNRVLLEPANE